MFNYNKIVVHSGVFHADDVFTVATINMICDKIYSPRPELIRTFNVAPYENDSRALIADIGGGEFDHHFPDDQKQRRENGIPYAAFGLVMRKFHNFLMSDEAYEVLDKHFIASLDYNDNDGVGNEIASAFSAFNPNWDMKEDPDANFKTAVFMAEMILDRQIRRAISTVKAKEIAETAPITNRVMYLDQFVPIGGHLADKPVDFTGSPSLRGGYQLISVRDEDGNNKKLFPEEYRGKNFDGTDEYGMKFCHSSGFLMSFIDKEHAMKFMKEKM